MVILLAICALVGGYFFLRYFNRIDTFLFGSTTEDYEPFGVITVIICAFAGALGGGKEFLNKMFHWDWNITIVNSVIAVCLAYCVYSAIVRMHSVGVVIGKILFLWVACAIGVVVGALGAVVVICVLAVMAVLYVAGALLGGSGSKGGKRWKLEDGTEVNESSGLMGEKYYRGNNDRNYGKSGDNLFHEK